MVHCKAPDGCNRHQVAGGSGSHRASSCVADQCQITRHARAPLSVISLSRAPRTLLPGWIPEALNFPRRREVFSTRGHERGQGDSPMAECGTNKRQGCGWVSECTFRYGSLDGDHWKGMTGRDVGLLSTRRKTCDRSAGQGSVMEGGSMSARHRAVIVRYKGRTIRNIWGQDCSATC